MTEEGQVDEEMKASKPQPVTENSSFTTETSLSSPANPAARRAKIRATIGPACHSEAAMRDLFRLGMDVARLNFSHGSHEDHARNIERLRRAADREGQSVCILQDLQGPKIRTGRLERHEPVEIKSGSTVIITPRDLAGTATRISTTFPDLAREVEPGARILLTDGLIELRVRGTRGKDVICDVLNGGTLGEHQGINLPGVGLSIPALTPKDRKDLEFGLTHGVDAVALSFVRRAADVRTVKQIIAAHHSDIPVIAKLEKPQAIDHLEEILEVADGVMVARGDLGVEVAPEKVPVIQKQVIRRAAAWRKPVITATQMLESMIENTRPTRAEASDVANAILDGADAVMLSGETSVGKYPLVAVRTMARIICAVEDNSTAAPPLTHVPRTKRGVISYAARDIGERLDAKALVAFTQSGDTVRRLARLHTPLPLLAFTPLPEVRSQLAMTWGTETFIVPIMQTTDGMIRQVDKSLLSLGRYKRGDLVVIVAGAPPGTVGSTNLIHVHRIGEEDV